MGDVGKAALPIWDMSLGQLSKSDPMGRGSQKRAEKAAKSAAAEQQKMIAKQRQLEELKLAEADDEVATRRALITNPQSRSLLIASQPKGAARMGGTNV